MARYKPKGVRGLPQEDKSEARIQREISEALRAAGCMVVRVNAGRKGGVQLAPKGTPDLIVVTPAHGAIWMEVKRPGETPSEKQVEFHDFLRASGERVSVVVSAEEAVSCLRS